MVAAYKIENAADELIEALLEMAGLLAAQERFAQDLQAEPRFPGLAVPQAANLNEIDERLTVTIDRVNSAVATYRAIR